MNILFWALCLCSVARTVFLLNDVHSKTIVLSRAVGLVAGTTFIFALAGTVIGFALGGAVLSWAVMNGLLGYTLATGFLWLLNNMKLGPY